MLDTLSYAFRIGDGERGTITLATASNVLAVAAIAAREGVRDFPARIKVWCPLITSEHAARSYDLDLVRHAISVVPVDALAEEASA